MRLSFLGNGQVHTANTTPDGAVLEQNLKNGMEQVAGKMTGETVTGTVVDKHGNEVLISIGKNQLLQAKLDGSIQIDLGKQFTFVVKNAAGGRVTLSPLLTNLVNDPNVSKALQMAGIPETDASVSMVKAMMQEGMPIDKNSLQQMMRSINLNPTANVETLVQMSRLQIPITEDHIFQFEAYKNYEHQISDGIMTIADSLSETMYQLNASGNQTDGIALFRDVLSLLSEAALGGEGKNEQGVVSVWDTLQETDAGSIPSLMGGAVDESNQMMLNSQKMMDGGVNKVFLTELGLTEEETISFAEQLKHAGFTELSEAVLSGQINKHTLFSVMSKLLGEENQFTERTEQTGKLLESPELNKLIKQEFKNQWMLSPEEVSENKKVEELYQRLNQHLNKLSSAFDQNTAQSPLAKAVNTLSGNIDFMNQLNQMLTYVQIPLKMQGQEASGELYVYTNKKNLAKEDGEVSALLHLDMEHLGSVNVHVSMKDQDVSTKFYLEDDRALDLIADHIEILNERLNKRGYQMNTSFIHQEGEKNSVMEEMLNQDKNISVLAGYSFDARA